LGSKTFRAESAEGAEKRDRKRERKRKKNVEEGRRR